MKKNMQKPLGVRTLDDITNDSDINCVLHRFTLDIEGMRIDDSEDEDDGDENSGSN
jgi:hypothetical protein